MHNTGKLIYTWPKSQTLVKSESNRLKLLIRVYFRVGGKLQLRPTSKRYKRNIKATVIY